MRIGGAIMVKFSDLVKDSVFKCADGFEGLHPEISVILPTFRRGDNGLFQKSVDSLLNQTFKNFELIIIDDASTDSTAEHIRNYMAKDPRVAVIRHQRNIGLPAVSQDEGFLRSRGAFYFYAFDDNEYDPAAMETLIGFLNEHPDLKAVYGASAFVLEDGSSSLIGDEDLDLDRQLTLNYIPNSPVLMRRELIDDVGFYDPHISMVRLCDWDLWCRIARKYPVGRVDKTLVKELSLSLSDSLANDYPLSKAAVRERMFTDRTAALRADGIASLEIDDISPALSRQSQREIKHIAETKFAPFFWSKKEYPLPEEGGRYLLAVVNCVEASTDMFLSSRNVHVVVLNEVSLAEEMAFHLRNASAVIFSRYISENYRLYAEVCRRIGTPYYYYTDDNFFDLGMQEFDGDTVEFLNGAEGFLFSTQALQDFFAARGYAPSETVAPVVFRPEQVRFDADRFADPEELRFLYASNMRMEGLLEFRDVLKRLRQRYKIRFFVFDRGQQSGEREEFIRCCKEDGIEVEVLAGERSYDAFLGKIADKGLHFVIHPAGKNAEFTKNCKYKTLNFAAVGAYASAFVFVPDVFPFSKIRDEYGLSGLVYATPEDVEREVARLLSDGDYARRSFDGLTGLCAKELDGDKNEAVFDGILSKASVEKRPFRISLADRLKAFGVSVMSTLTFGKLHKKLKKQRKFLKRKLRFFKMCEMFPPCGTAD